MRINCVKPVQKLVKNLSKLPVETKKTVQNHTSFAQSGKVLQSFSQEFYTADFNENHLLKTSFTRFTHSSTTITNKY